jgi:Rieske Fe-S protein
VLSLQRFAEQRWPARRDERWPSRRALLAQFGAAAGVIALTALGARLVRRSAPASGGTETAATGDALASVADVPVGGVKPVVTPAGVPVFLVRVADRQFVAFDRTCTHAGCRVGLAAGGKTFRCPCHGGEYDARTGDVLAGPPPRPLNQLPVRISGNQVQVHVPGSQVPPNDQAPPDD